MTGWSHHKGMAVALPVANIDTDQLIPARFMSVPRTKGYGNFLLHDVRRDAEGNLRPDFPLNCHPQASILIASRNFGSGSSREAAVYALVDAGIKAVAAPGFGDIFAGNAVNNGLLPARISESDADRLLQALSQGPGLAEVDLRAGSLVVDGISVSFELDEIWRTKLMSGWDDIDLTRQHDDEISRFRVDYEKRSPWNFSGLGKT